MPIRYFFKQLLLPPGGLLLLLFFAFWWRTSRPGWRGCAVSAGSSVCG